MDRENRIIKGSVLIKNGEIKKVGNINDLDVEETIDANGKLVMPGLVSAYTSLDRILLEAAPIKSNSSSDFIQFIQRVKWKLEQNLTKKDVYQSSLATSTKLLKSGTTFFGGICSSQGEIGKSLDEAAKAIEKVGIRACIGFEATERHTRAKGARGMRENIRFLENRSGPDDDEKIKGLVGLDSSYVVSDELLRHGKRVANQFEVPILIPTARTEADPYYNLIEHGKRTVERFRDVGLLSPKTILNHCTFINEEEISTIEKFNSKVAFSPLNNLSNIKEGSIITRLKGKGIKVGLGNTGDALDGFEGLRFLHLVHKLSYGKFKSITPIEAIELATIKSAELYGMEEKIGSIEKGKKGDIIIIDPSPLPTPLRRENAAEHIVTSIGCKNIETVLVGGAPVVEDGRVKTLDEEKTMRKLRKKTDKIWKKIETIER